MGADVNYVRAVIDTYKVAANKEATIEPLKELCSSLDQLELSEEEKEAFRDEIRKELEQLGVLAKYAAKIKRVEEKKLEELPVTEVKEIIERYVREHPGALTSEIIEYTGLDPATVEEMLRSLEEEGKVRSEEVEAEPEVRKYSPGKPLKMFFCQRQELERYGGLLIMAIDEAEAIDSYKEFEKTDKEPYKVTEVDISSPGVVYDHFLPAAYRSSP